MKFPQKKVWNRMGFKVLEKWLPRPVPSSISGTKSNFLPALWSCLNYIYWHSELDIAKCNKYYQWFNSCISWSLSKLYTKYCFLYLLKIFRLSFHSLKDLLSSDLFLIRSLSFIGSLSSCIMFLCKIYGQNIPWTVSTDFVIKCMIIFIILHNVLFFISMFYLTLLQEILFKSEVENGRNNCWYSLGSSQFRWGITDRHIAQAVILIGIDFCTDHFYQIFCMYHRI